MATQVPDNQGQAFSSVLNVGDVIMRRFDRQDSKVKALTLHAYIASNNHATFRKIGVAAGYQVPAGKKFIALSQKSRGNTTGVTAFNGLNSGTTDVGFSSASPASGLDLDSTEPIQVARDTATVINTDGSTIYVVTAGRYLQLYATSVPSYVICYGYEVDVSVTNLDQE